MIGIMGLSLYSPYDCYFFDRPISAVLILYLSTFQRVQHYVPLRNNYKTNSLYRLRLILIPVFPDFIDSTENAPFNWLSNSYKILPQSCNNNILLQLCGNLILVSCD